LLSLWNIHIIADGAFLFFNEEKMMSELGLSKAKPKERGILYLSNIVSFNMIQSQHDSNNFFRR